MARRRAETARMQNTFQKLKRQSLICASLGLLGGPFGRLAGASGFWWTIPGVFGSPLDHLGPC
eukprot:5628250-Pyramimonas_sp.AAC.1